MAYITFDEMQQLLLNHIKQGRKPLDYPEACQMAMAQGLVHEEKPPIQYKDMLRHLTDAEFETLLHHYPLGLFSSDPIWPQSRGFQNEIYALQHLHNPGSTVHAPKRFRIFYAFKGEFDMLFEKKSYHLQTGDFVIIAPQCHSIAYTTEHSVILQLSIQIPTFEQLFNQVASDLNIIFAFLRSVLYSGNHVNYLLFHTQNDDFPKECFKTFFIQQMNFDPYTPQVLKANLALLLSHILRFYSTSASFYQSIDHRFSMTSVLMYIQNNWKNLSLDELASAFGYSAAYMSAVIRKETGSTYTSLIKKRRMEEAEYLLNNTNMKISDIALECGFQSPEHFSRSFRDFFGTSPYLFRKNV